MAGDARLAARGAGRPGSRSGLSDPLRFLERPAGLPPRAGRHRVGPLIGRGAMGVVCRGFDPELCRPVAIKFLNGPGSDGRPVERLLREGRAAAALQHPNLVTIHECGSEQGLPFLVMELVEGEDFAAFLRRDPGPPLGLRLLLLAQVCEALAHVHHHGIVHRDVKPANVLVSAPRGGSLPSAKLTDFGVARMPLESGDTATGALVGTLGYIAPERVSGEAATARSDLFAVGVMLFEALAGCRPFEGASAAQVLDRIVHAAPPFARLDPALPEELVELLRRTLAKEPARRPAGAQPLADALHRVSRTLPGAENEAWSRAYRPALRHEREPAPVPATAATIGAGTARLRRRRGVALALLVAALALAGGLLARRRGSPLPVAPETLRFERGRVQVLAADGTILLERSPSRPLDEVPIPQLELDLKILREDLNADGVADLAFVVPCGEACADQVWIYDGASRRIAGEISTDQRVEGTRSLHPPVYEAFRLGATHDARGRAESLFVVAASRLSGLSYLLLTDAAGLPRGQYWFHGHIRRSIAELDLDGDGRSELIVPARHAHHPEMSAALAVFDPHDVQGFAPAPAGFAGFPPGARGSHLSYVVFPRSELTPPGFHNHINLVPLLTDSCELLVRIQEGSEATAWGSLLWRLAPGLGEARAEPQGSFLVGWMAARARGMVSGEPDREYLEGLGAGVRFHDGERWLDE